MKQLLIVLFTLIYFSGFTQSLKPSEDTNRYFKNPTQYGQQIPRIWGTKLVRVPDTLTSDRPKQPGAISTNGVDKIYVWDGNRWNQTSNTTIIKDSSGNIVGHDTLTGGPFSSVPQVGFNPGSNLTPAQIVQAAFYASQVPTASLTGGQLLELMADGDDLPFTLNWTAGRSFATQPLSTIIVDGNSQSFGQPGLNASVSGTQGVTVQRNSNTTFVIEVTTTDGKTAQATTAFTFSPKRYAGWSATNNPNDATILAGILNEFSTTNDKGTSTNLWNVPAPSGPKYFFYAYPSSFGNLTSFILNGFESINSLTLVKRNVQNASGYVQEYNIYVSNNLLAYGLSIQAQ